MILHDHLQNIKASPKHGNSQSPQRCLPRIVDGNIVNNLDQIPSDVEELLLVEAVIHQLI